MIISHVVACSENGIIGINGKLPWHLPEELKRFKEITIGKIIIMGRRTHESIGRVLPGRFTIVISRQKEKFFKDVAKVGTIEEALALAESISGLWGNEACIVGGGEIYRQTKDIVEKVYITKIHITIEGDTIYPIEILKVFRLKGTSDSIKSSPQFSVSVYEKKL